MNVPARSTDPRSSHIAAADLVTSGALRVQHAKTEAAVMAKAGHSRSMRRDTLKSLFNGKPSAAGSATPSAGGNETSALLQGLLDNIKA